MRVLPTDGIVTGTGSGRDWVHRGRTTLLLALSAPEWPRTQPVFVLTSSPLPEGTPDHVTQRQPLTN